MHMGSNALAIISDFADTVSDWNVTKFLGRRLFHVSETTPSWVDHRKLLDAKTKSFKHKPNVTVALDGSGDVKSINEALTKLFKEITLPPLTWVLRTLPVHTNIKQWH
ncbi:putative pectinesterase/pectinesterase inhibitor 21-like [Trifolium medium]|uniref:Putative pectinesterase/pectinesterase inhibitor 21-like n=1 Tax=Trifolium medium TaxID=97028 RepID=A0A392Q667_9FABA|nr:putative pectinesterase/pectinesterase inhibitor 21-like [Trifolium medium]